MSPSHSEYSTWLYNDLDVYVNQKKNCLKIIIKFKKKLFERSFIEEMAKGFSKTVNLCIADYQSARKKVIS